jgi:hypothetical protein
VEQGAILRVPEPNEFYGSPFFDPEGPGPVSARYIQALFEDKTRTDPADPVGTLRAFSARSRGLLRPEDLVEKEGVARFTQAGRAYTMDGKRPWEVNRVLEDVDVPERFVRLEGGTYVLTIPDRLNDVAREFHLPLPR